MKLVSLRPQARRAAARRRSSSAPIAPSLRIGLEQRADAASARVVRGDPVAPQSLGQAPVARAAVTGSPGAPLPSDLRTSFERSFDADLGAVRLHTDDAAATAVRARGARGLAAGRDVYVDLRGHELRSERGRALLAHEVAHVLQQTGRRRKGRLVATDLAGSADPQYADDFVEYIDNIGVFDRGPSWDQIKAQYAKVSDYATHLAVIEPHIPGTLPASPADIEGLAGEIFDKPAAATKLSPSNAVMKASFKTLSNDLKSFYVDSLKFVGGFDYAARILLANDSLTTRWRSRAMYEAIRAIDLTWVIKIASRLPFLKPYYPDRFISVYRYFFFSPGAGPQDLDPDAWKSGKSFKDKVKDEVERLKDAKLTTRVNELEVATLLAMRNLETARVDGGNATIARGARTTWQVIDYYTALAQSFVNGPATSNRLTGLPVWAEPRALFVAQFSELQKQAQKAVDYWKRVGKFFRATRAKQPFEDMSKAVATAIFDKVKTASRFAKLPAFLRDTARKVFALGKGKALPDAAAFAGTVTERLAAVRQQMASYAVYLSEMARTDTQTEDDALTLGVVFMYLDGLEYALYRYDAAKDRETSKKGRTDHRDAARFRVADVLQDLGNRFGWTDLRDAANAEFDRGGKMTVAILSDWTPETATDYAKIVKDLGGVTNFTMAVTGLMLATFGEARYWEVFASTLSGKLRDRANDFSNVMPVLTDAFRAMKSQARPRRWITQDWEVGGGWRQRPIVTVSSPTDSTGFADAIHAHPYTAALEEREVPAKEGPNKTTYTTAWSLAPDSPEAALGRPLWLWIVPGRDEFARRVAKLGPVRTEVDKRWTDAHGTRPPDPELDPIGWLDAFAEYTRFLAADPAKLTKLGEDLAKYIDAEKAAAVKKANEQGRLATSHQRRVVLGLLISKLDSFDRSDVFQRHRVPAELFAEIRKFAALVFPEEDQRLQVAALMIELGFWINNAFGFKQDFPFDQPIIDWRQDYMANLQLLVWGALEMWDAAQAKVTPAAPINEITAISPYSQDLMELSAGALRRFQKALETKIVDTTTKQGLRGFKGELDAQKQDKQGRLQSIYWKREGSVLFKLTGFRSEVYLGDQFPGPTAAYDYALVNVREDFVFHPRLAAADDLGIAWPQEGRPGGARVLDPDGNPIPADRVLIAYNKVPTKGGDPIPATIKAGQIAELTQFYNLVDNILGRLYLASGAALAMKHAELVMTVMELVIPGVDKILTATRFAAAIDMALSNPEFLDALKSIKEDGIKAFPKIFAFLAQFVDFEQLALTILFDSDFKSDTKDHETIKGKTDRADKIGSKGGFFAGLARVVRNVVQIGLRVLESLKRLAKKVQTPVRAAQLWVTSHPIAGWILGWVALGFEYLSSMSLEDFAETIEDLKEKDWKDLLIKAATEAMQGIVDRGRTALDSLRHLEMPYEVIPQGLLADFIINLAIEIAGGKYKKPIKAVRDVLKTIGLWSKITAVIESELGVDPNEPYREHIRKNLNPWFVSVRDEFVEDLVAFLKGIPFLDKLSDKPGTPVDLDLSGVFPDTPSFEFEMYPAGGVEPTGGPLPNPSGGERLAPTVRSSAEATLGHDLSHVRLHRGDDAARMTGAVAAEGVTTGSHVYLRPGLSPESGFGAHVLHHELGHVLQQAGPRPLDRSHSDAPSAGSAGRGLHHDGDRESAADRVASIAARGQVAHGPIDAGGPSHGVQPKGKYGVDFLRKFLGRLKEGDKDIKENAEELKKEKERGEVALDPKSQAVASSLGPALQNKLEGMPDSAFKPPYTSIKKELKALLVTTAPDIAALVPYLVQRAVTTVVPRRTKGEGGPGKVNPYLDPEALVVQIERALAGITAMSFSVDLDDSVKGGPEVKNKKMINPKAPLKSLTFLYLHLPYLPAGTGDDLWDLLVTNTFKGTPSYSTKAIDPKIHAVWVGVTRLVLGKVGPQYDTYDASIFKLSARKAKVVRAQFDRMSKILTRAIAKGTKWPTKAEYVKTDMSTTPDETSRFGLRLGTHKTITDLHDLRTVPDAPNADRDSHHTVQFLLFQYLYNDKLLKPFPLLGKVDYPGVARSGKSNVLSIGKIKVEQFYGGNRGDDMTAVSLSRHTHQGGIHYRTEAADDGSEKRPTQGFAINSTFHSAMDSRDVFLRDEPALTALAAKKPGEENERVPGSKPGTKIAKNELADAIFSAAQETYRDMWKYMKPKLKSALENQEVAYYNAVAAQAGVAADMTAGDMQVPFNTIVNKTEQVMGDAMGGAKSS